MTSGVDRSELLEQAAQLVMAGRPVAMVGSDHEDLSTLLGELAMSLIEFGGEIVRVDGLVSHQPAALLQSLVNTMAVPQSELVDTLRFRGETGNPLLLLIDNGECLSADAFAQLASLVSQAAGGVGLVLAGEPELVDLLPPSGLQPELVFDADQVAAAPLPDEAEPVQLPWRHIAAVIGLLMLVWLLWPQGDSEQEATVRTLSLPPPMAVPETVVAEPAPVSRPLSVEVPPAPVAAAPLSAPEPIPVLEPEPEAELASAPEVVQKPEPPSAPEPVETASPSVKSERQLTGIAAELAYREDDWFLTLPPEQWLLQLAVTSSEDAARALVTQAGPSKAGYYRSRRESRLVYIVMAGPWPSRDAALAGRDELPGKLRDSGPFPRQVGEIQGEIGAH